MGIVDNLRKDFINNTRTNVASEFCPNCWGRQEYSGGFYDEVKVKSLGIDTIDSKKGWILAYAERYLTGIQLVDKGEKQLCPNCQASFNKTN